MFQKADEFFQSIGLDPMPEEVTDCSGKARVPCSMFLVQYSLFLVSCFLFHVPCSLFHVPCSMFHVPCSKFNVLVPFYLFHVPCSKFHVPCSMFDVPSSMFHVPCFMFHVPCSMFHEFFQSIVLDPMPEEVTDCSLFHTVRKVCWIFAVCYWWRYYKARCDVKCRKIKGIVWKFSHIVLSNSVTS